MDMVQDSIPAVQEEVKELAGLLSKAAKNYQMYLPNNRIFISSLGKLKAALENFLQDNEALTFVVKEFELVHGDTPVYVNTDKYQSIAFRMYRDGVRLLSFHEGISDDELLAFFEALTRCLESDSLEEDFVTLLWEKDLQYITYYEVNDLEAQYQDLRRDAREMREPEASFKMPDLSPERSDAVSSDVERLRPALTLHAEDLEEVQDLATAVDDDLFLTRAWQVLSLTLESERAKEVYLDLENGLVAFLDICVVKHHIDLAAEALGTIRQLYRRTDDKDIRRALARIVMSRHAEKNMVVIEEILSGGREIEQVQCLAYLSRLHTDAIPAVVRLLTGCTRHSAKQTVISALASLGRDCPEAIVSCVDVSSPEEMEAVLDVLDTIGTEAALARAMRFRDHASPRIRARVASLLGELKTEAAVETAEAMVKDEDHSVRRRAVISLAKIGGDRCIETLLGFYTSKEFGLLSHESKLSMLLAIRNLPPHCQKRIIEAILKMRSFFKRKPIEDTKASLIEILHLMEEDVAGEALHRLLTRSSGRLRDLAEAVARKVSNGD